MYKVFVGDTSSGIVQLKDMYALFMRTSTKFIKTRLGIRDWRQIMVQIVEKNVSSTSMLNSSFIRKFLEMQAVHGSTVGMLRCRRFQVGAQLRRVYSWPTEAKLGVYRGDIRYS